MKNPKPRFKKYKESFSNGKTVWIAENKKYNIIVQAPTLKALNQRVRDTIAGHIAICRVENLVPFESLINKSVEISTTSSKRDIADDEYSSSAGYGGWGPDE